MERGSHEIGSDCKSQLFFCSIVFGAVFLASGATAEKGAARARVLGELQVLVKLFIVATSCTEAGGSVETLDSVESSLAQAAL